MIDRNDLSLLAFDRLAHPMTYVPDTTPQGPEASSFFGLTRESLAQRLALSGVPAYRAGQLFSWVYRRHVSEPADMTSLPLALRQSIAGLVDLGLPRDAGHLASPDGDTHKFALELGDGRRVECVSMRAERGLTFCLSSQVGCALRCPFCATGLAGLAAQPAGGRDRGAGHGHGRLPRLGGRGLQPRAHGHGRAARQLRGRARGHPHPARRAGAQRGRAAHHGLDRGPGAADRARSPARTSRSGWRCRCTPPPTSCATRWCR